MLHFFGEKLQHKTQKNNGMTDRIADHIYIIEEIRSLISL